MVLALTLVGLALQLAPLADEADPDAERAGLAGVRLPADKMAALTESIMRRAR